VIQSALMPVCTDLIAIGPNTIFRQDSIILGYKAQSNYIHTGPIHVGANAFVGEASILDINTIMEDDTQLGHASSLHDGQRVPRGKHFHGTPAVETPANYCPAEPRVCTTMRRYVYSVVLLVAWFVLLPIPVVVLFAWASQLYDLAGGGAQFDGETPAAALLLLAFRMLLLSFTVFFIAVVFGAFVIGAVPRFMNL